jgi:alcohol dehydrogenase class IV
VDEATRIYKEADCQGIICVGGGSAMDTGKSVGVVVASGSASIREHCPPTVRSVAGMAPVICAPTTAGTGAEVNPYAIVTNTETGKKVLAYPGWELLSAQRVAVVDPDLSASMPPRLTAITGVDALCQAVECYITGVPTGSPNPISDVLALRAAHLVAHNLRRVVFDGRDINARVNMSLAAMLGTMAFPNAGLTHAHALNEVLMERHHMSHGEAVGAVLVATLESFLPVKTERLARIATIFGVPTDGCSQRQIAEAGIREIQQLLKDIGFPTLSQCAGGQAVDVEALMRDFLDRYPAFQPAGPQERVRYTLQRSLEF